jgi:hypothetical protein
MRELNYDETWINNNTGNTVGIIRSNGGPTTMLNGHMDLEFCDDLTFGTMSGKTYAPIYEEVRDAIA